MPSPGVDDIRSELFPVKFTVEGGYKTQIDENSAMASRLSAALDAGWVAAIPSTPTTMTTAITTEFADISATGHGKGHGFLLAIGMGIDQEVTAWAGSWDTTTGKHKHKVESSKIHAAILKASPTQSNAVTALSNAVAAMFASNFSQEGEKPAD